MNTTNRSIIRNTFYIQLLAFILLSLSSSVGSMVDGVVIGQFLGVDSTAAFGIITPLMIAFSIIGAVVSAGARNRFTKLLGADAVWWAYPVSQFLVMCYYGIVVAVESRRIRIHREGLWNRVLLLPDTFDVSDKDKLDVTITMMDDVMQLTDAVWNFCDAHDCLIFDPVRQVRLLSDEDPTYHIGLRMIATLAKDIQYTCVLKLNNILVKI